MQRQSQHESEQVEQRQNRASSLKTRVLTALLLAPIVLGLTIWLPTFWFGLLLGAICGLCLFEWNRLTANSVLLFCAGVTAIFALALTIDPDLPGVGRVCIAISCYWIYQLVDMRRNGLHRSMGPKVGLLEGLVLMSAFWLAMVLLHNQGPVLVIAAMMTVWAADSCAYFAGKAFGRTPLAPVISPKKTIEGVAGGLLGSLLVLLVFSRYAFAPPIAGVQLWIWLLAGIAAASISVVGDLFESRIKRRAGVKDSGNILPGHGGILDRVDGLIAALPMFAGIWMLVS